jgi:vacuolar-type H+-ATPase subunit E/Vma4
MKLHELAAPRATKQISQVFESYFGSRLSFDQLNRQQAGHMLNRVRSILGEHRQTAARHTSEQNPEYLKLVMMEQALTARLKEMTATPAPATGMNPAAKPAAGVNTGATPSPATGMNPAAKPVDPKLKAAQDKIKKGQALTPDEQNMINTQATTMAENRLRRAYRYLKESEVQQAQVVLAAQDMVDKMQGMLEDVSELQFKELPALVDSIKNQVGIDQATQFNTDVSSALTALMQSLQGTKQQLDSALGVVTGQTAPAAEIPGMDAGLDAGAAADLDADAAAGVGDELDDLDAMATDAADDLDADTGAPAASLGRARR